jgi:antitoxin CptB
MDDNSQKRIAWKCRRGMLELDLLLTQFYREQFPQLSPREQALFDALLDEDDPVLASWLFGSVQPTNPDFIYLINKYMKHI